MVKAKNNRNTCPIKPRGIRNNNPLNIRIGNTWLGEIPNPTDSDFEQFVSASYGLRAGFIILRRYIRRYGRNTVSKIIRAWAPSSENDTQRYIDIVARRMAIDPNAIIDYADKDTMCRLVAAMAYVENGCEISEATILAAYEIS